MKSNKNSQKGKITEKEKLSWSDTQDYMGGIGNVGYLWNYIVYFEKALKEEITSTTNPQALIADDIYISPADWPAVLMRPLLTSAEPSEIFTESMVLSKQPFRSPR